MLAQLVGFGLFEMLGWKRGAGTPKRDLYKLHLQFPLSLNSLTSTIYIASSLDAGSNILIGVWLSKISLYFVEKTNPSPSWLIIWT